MALDIKKDTMYGISATYFKILETNINYLNGVCHVTLAGYADKVARDAGAEPLMLIHFDWPEGPDGVVKNMPITISEQNKLDKNTVSIAYTVIKSLSAWKNALDV